MAGPEAETGNQEGVDSDHESDIGTGGKGLVTPREKILFTMSLIRTLCGVLSGLASAMVLLKIYHLGGQ